MTYTYDSLNRLLTANGSGWGQQYGFDSFGNLLSKTVTAGSGPSLSVSVNAANNQIQGVSGLSYDANGNQNVGTYDAENRLSTVINGSVSTSYFYDAQNRRIYSSTGTRDVYNNPTNYTVNIYTPGGQKLGAYVIAPAFVNNPVQATMFVTLSSNSQYFGGHMLAAMDQLGSVGTYYPWGENKGGTNPQDNFSFATYWRDSATSLDYANNRYYSNAYGRFMTPDPYTNSGRLNDPQSWNRYAYALGDPTNRHDPTGLMAPLVCGGFGDEGEGDASDDCGFIGFNQGCDSGDVMAFGDGPQMPSPCNFVPVVPVFAPAPPKVITLRVIDECIFPNGTGISPGNFTLEVEYQVLVNGAPVLGNSSLSGAGINQVNETVTNTGGNVNYGSGNWCLSTATCDMPGSLTPSGTFWDVLSGNGTANQSFLINGQAIAVLFPSTGTAGLTTWQDVFNSPGKSISVGNGAVKGNSSIRICGSKKGDPTTN